MVDNSIPHFLLVSITSIILNLVPMTANYMCIELNNRKGEYSLIPYFGIKSVNNYLLNLIITLYFHRNKCLYLVERKKKHIKLEIFSWIRNDNNIKRQYPRDILRYQVSGLRPLQLNMIMLYIYSLFLIVISSPQFVKI